MLPTRAENPKPGQEYRDRNLVLEWNVRWQSLKSPFGERNGHWLALLIPYVCYTDTKKGALGVNTRKPKTRRVQIGAVYNNVENIAFASTQVSDMATKSDKYVIFL